MVACTLNMLKIKRSTHIPSCFEIFSYVVCVMYSDCMCFNYASFRVFLPFQSRCARIEVTWFGVPRTFVSCCYIPFSRAITYVGILGTIIVCFVNELAMVGSVHYRKLSVGVPFLL